MALQVRVDVSPWLMLPAEGEIVGFVIAGFIVIDGDDDGCEVAPALSVTLTVIVGAVVDVAVYLNVEAVMPGWATPPMYHWYDL